MICLCRGVNCFASATVVLPSPFSAGQKRRQKKTKRNTLDRKKLRNEYGAYIPAAITKDVRKSMYSRLKAKHTIFQEQYVKERRERTQRENVEAEDRRQKNALYGSRQVKADTTFHFDVKAYISESGTQSYSVVQLALKNTHRAEILGPTVCSAFRHAIDSTTLETTRARGRFVARRRTGEVVQSHLPLYRVKRERARVYEESMSIDEQWEC